MLLPSAIQRSDDLVGMATPTVPASPPSPLPLSSPPHAARASARLPAAMMESTFRTVLLHSLRGGRVRPAPKVLPCPSLAVTCPPPTGGRPGSTAAPG